MSDTTETNPVVNAAVNAAGEAAYQVGYQVYRRPLPLILGGLVVGLAAGATGGYLFARRRLETKYNQIAGQEIAEMRQHYQDKALSLDNTMAKPTVAEIVQEKGYSEEPPLAVTPPESVVEAVKEIPEPPTDPRPKPSVPIIEPETQTVFEQDQPQSIDGWDYHTERTRRSPLHPYVIHKDEMQEQNAYDEITLTYYEADDVLCNERDEPVDKDKRDMMVGEANLDRFGHGSGDPSIVYVRNDRLELDMEVVRSPNAYAEEVHGFQHSDVNRRIRRERTSFDDE